MSLTWSFQVSKLNNINIQNKIFHPYRFSNCLLQAQFLDDFLVRSIPQYLRKMRKWIEMTLATVGSQSSFATISVKPPPADASEPRTVSAQPSPNEGCGGTEATNLTESQHQPSEGCRESTEPPTTTSIADSKEGILPAATSNSVAEPSESIAPPVTRLSPAASRAIAEEQRRLLQQLERVEASFSVCSLLYQKFDLIFRQLFRDPQEQRELESCTAESLEEPAAKKSRCETYS